MKAISIHDRRMDSHASVNPRTLVCRTGTGRYAATPSTRAGSMTTARSRLEHGFDADPEQAERQQEQPDQRIQDQRQQGERPAQEQQAQPDRNPNIACSPQRGFCSMSSL
jgi:hypothetical protein